MMKFFEFRNPYFALIKAENKEDAVKEYINTVAGDEEDFEGILRDVQEVDKFYAENKLNELFKVSEVYINYIFDEDLVKEQKRRILNNKETEVILMDASLV